RFGSLQLINRPNRKSFPLRTFACLCARPNFSLEIALSVAATKTELVSHGGHGDHGGWIDPSINKAPFRWRSFVQARIEYQLDFGDSRSRSLAQRYAEVREGMNLT